MSASVFDPGTWIFPVPDLGDRRPEVSDGWGSPRHDRDGTRTLHLGADIMFRRRSRSDLIEVFKPGTPNATAGYYMPDNVPALAAGAGVVVLAEWTVRGFTVRIRHANGWLTYYTHLSLLFVQPEQTIAAGAPIGVVGFDPTDRRKLMHLHFELWRGSKRWAAVNPKPYLDAWQRRTIDQSVPRNATAFRSPGKAGERYPDWLQALGDKSGAYVIRERRGGKTITRYVGESHTSRLYDSLTRHMQVWLRHAGFRKGTPGSGPDPGLMYDRNRIEIAVAVTKPNAAAAEKARLIRTMQPHRQRQRPAARRRGGLIARSHPMEELIEAIRAAVTSGATTEQRTRGAHACRAILTALDAEAGKPLVVANAPTAHPLAGIPPGQALDLLIAKLSAALPPEDKNRDPAQGAPAPERQGIRIKFIPAPTRPRSLGSSGRPPHPPRRKP